MKSHTKKELLDAQTSGKKLWKLNTGNDGEDDILIGEKAEVIADIRSYYEIENIPDDWTLTEIDYSVGDELL